MPNDTPGLAFLHIPLVQVTVLLWALQRIHTCVRLLSLSLSPSYSSSCFLRGVVVLALVCNCLQARKRLLWNERQSSYSPGSSTHTHAHPHSHIHARKRTHTRTHAHTHTRTHVHANAHAHTQWDARFHFSCALVFCMCRRRMRVSLRRSRSGRMCELSLSDTIMGTIGAAMRAASGFASAGIR